MIPLRDCSPLQLAVLSARAMETPHKVSQADEEAPPKVWTETGCWSPAEDISDAMRLAAWAVLRGKLCAGITLLDPVTVLADTLRQDDEEHNSRQEVPEPTPEAMLQSAAKALALSVLSALDVQGFQEKP